MFYVYKVRHSFGRLKNLIWRDLKIGIFNSFLKLTCFPARKILLPKEKVYVLQQMLIEKKKMPSYIMIRSIKHMDIVYEYLCKTDVHKKILKFCPCLDLDFWNLFPFDVPMVSSFSWGAWDSFTVSIGQVYLITTFFILFFCFLMWTINWREVQ